MKVVKWKTLPAIRGQVLRDTKQLKILHVNTHDTQGGASRAACRLVRALLNSGVDCQLVVQNRRGDEPFVQGGATKLSRLMAEVRPYADRLPLLLYPERSDSPYHCQWCPEKTYRVVKKMGVDIVHLHWICGGFVQIESIGKIDKPMVWTLHDMWPFTGGCHFSGSCSKYIDHCGSCPQLVSRRDRDLSRWVVRRKEKGWKDAKLHIVAPSRWLADKARASKLFRHRQIVVIPNCIDSNRFKPIDRSVARAILGLPHDKKLIMFSAMNFRSDPRKGFPLLLDSLTELRRGDPELDLEIVLVGQSEPREPLAMGYPTHYMGRLHDDVALALTYASADVFVTPSTEDNLPNTVMEAMACGTPCVAFEIGGMPDLIDHQRNGFLATPFRTDKLAQGIHWVLAGKERNRELSDQARGKVMRAFDEPVVAARYATLYQEVKNADQPI